LTHFIFSSLPGATTQFFFMRIFISEMTADKIGMVELKRTGHPKLCLHNDELDFLTELVAFLKPFRDLTDLFSSIMPTLSVIPLMKMRIKKNCVVAPSDDEKIKCVREAVLAKLNYRFPETESVKLRRLLDPETKDLLPRSQESLRTAKGRVYLLTDCTACALCTITLNWRFRTRDDTFC